MFELHTEGANPIAVPPAAVAGKNRPQVNRAILDLMEVGYSLLDLQINPVDSSCAELSMLLDTP